MGHAKTQLLVSDADKEKAWLDVDDESLGRFCRWFIIKANEADAEAAEASDMPMLSLMAMHAGVALCRFAHDCNAETYTADLKQVSSASGPLGDWKITVKKTGPALAAGTRSAETRSKAQSEGCQSGPQGNAHNPSETIR
jgi:hypothetical protein